MNVFKINNLEIKIGDKTILKDINLDIKEGEVTCILGKNGCGKTTLLKTMCKDIKPTRGEILLNNKNIRNIKPKEFSKEVAYLTQHRNIITDLSVEELVSHGRFTHRKVFEKENLHHEEIIKWAMEKANIYHMKDRLLSCLSGGELQRAWIAMNIAQKPKILILDEPTTFLDISHQIEVLSLIKELNKSENMTVIMVLHDINHALRFCHNGVLIKNGKVYDFGIIREIINEKSIEDVFEIEVEKLESSRDIVYNPIEIRS
ncbi:ABC transporter ATP-binding protein [Terrisporobacter glycolicus]|nr:ABC transporter ATP-binding protein [Terrisporobacter glycolicus]